MFRSQFIVGVIITLALAIPAQAEQQPLTHQAIINAPVERVWNAFTTSEGLESWMAPHADIELRVGGLMRSTYDPNGTLGDESTIENTIISYLPQRMLSFRNTKAPKDLLFKTSIENMWTVLEFAPVGDSQTRLTITGLGYSDDPESLRMREFFKLGNQQTIDRLKSKLERNSSSESDIADPHLKPLARFVGGQWIVSGTWANGEVLHGRDVHEWTLDAKVIRSRTFLPKPDGTEYQRYETLTAWDAHRKSLVYHSIAYNGAVTVGNIQVVDQNTLLYPPAPDPDGKPGVISQTLKFTDNDTMIWNVYQKLPDGTEKELIEATWRRIGLEDKLPYEVAPTPSSTSATSASNSISDAIEVETTVNAPLAQVWQAWTTSGGAQEFFAPHTEIDLRLGGDYHIHFNPTGEAGTRGAETEKILSYLPMRMLSFDWGAPPQFAHARTHPCTIVLLFDPIDDQTTRVRLVHHGFAQRKAEFPQHAQEYDKVREYFSAAWPKVLSWLKRRFDEGPRWDAQGKARWN